MFLTVRAADFRTGSTILILVASLWGPGLKAQMKSGFIFSSKGTNYKPDSLYYSLAPAFIEIPFHAVCYFGRRSFKVSILAGPYVSMAFGGYKIEANSYQNLSFGRD